ncbi:endonuclease domain-containing protein [Caulobacter vibrioides]|uniref:DUF559 domain-containing protein n=2 Tax=Caulobacter vibrioides TaxID=155892 RepID=Q9A4J3_CAUVC|nr:endonuclease domain-containing protein [Caulobacter vibrioides]YP_002518303.1 very short patch repair (Vsr) endonuclease [Caulobacter vibrioides NA1000]AAK24802.1 conserved hypothetical protein [Caulobacter vibrioides CB15]ACL96395.1 very short patch repair (Vsr) endonuclease [Caulobacter vibrioides NA1000]ATC29671.1 DUF559 domain-containing protein [Caulobacter vibrioides]QXZ51192.1 endonuclease domain-containing protein [Caulobacter vibrioides]
MCPGDGLRPPDACQRPPLQRASGRRLPLCPLVLREAAPHFAACECSCIVPSVVERSRQLDFARRLRRDAPAMERVLWRLLRDRRLDGLKFRRQLPIGRYVVDFACLRHRLIVEADGPYHDEARDAQRDAWLAGQGFRVLRFKNDELNNPDRVLGLILEACAAPPSPLAGEGVDAVDG